MFQLLKRIALYFYFAFVRSAKREHLVKTLTSKFSKYKLDTAAVPDALDEVWKLPQKWQDSISFAGFDNQGICARIKAHKSHNGYGTLQIDLDIPGYGHFSQNEVVGYRNKRNNDTDYHFGGGKINLFCHSPMKRWKVYFRGPLKHMNSDGKRMHATVSLFWQCSFDPYDHLLSPSCWDLADSFSSFRLRDIFNFSPLDSIVSYDQWGELRGRISIETHEEITVRLRCVRERSFKHQNFYHFNSGSRQHFVENESGLSISNQTIKLGNDFVQSGYVYFPTADSMRTRLHNGAITDHGTPNAGGLSQSIWAGKNIYCISETSARYCFSNESSGFKFTTLIINGKRGFGVQYSFDDTYMGNETEIDNRTQAESTYINDTEVSYTDHPQIVNLDIPTCNLKSLVGCKAYLLSVLKSSTNCNVPNGFCVTTLAFTKHVSSHHGLRKAVDKVKDCLKYLNEKTLEQSCDSAVRLLQDTAMNYELQNNVRNELNEVFGRNEWKTMKFAIRSSGVSEDTSETSTAGQLETYLCVQGFDNIISAIQHCWASSVSYRVIEYRRQNGQELLENVGVVVQEMVDADAAGVLFSVDPVTGNESNMVINANYGLGMSVATGSVNPDTVVVSRDEDCKLKIKTVHIGSKEVRIIAGDTNGTIQEPSSCSDKHSLCMSDEDIIRISEQGIEIENCLGTPQDIEWAIAKGELYILQARPISVFDIETEEELIHEFDTPVVSEKEFLTPCNIQEMMPGVMTTLTGDLFVCATNRAVVYNIYSRLGIQPPVHSLVQVLSFSGYPFINVTGWALKDIGGFGGDNAKSHAEVGIVGRPVKEHTVESIKDYYGRKISFGNTVCQALREFIVLNKRDSRLYERLVNEIKTTSFASHSETAEELYQWIDENLIFYFDMWKAYIYKLTTSIRVNGIIIGILKGNAKEVTVEHLADMALILAECKNVISAEVPHFVHDLAKQIAKSDIKQQFLSLSPEDCDSFLRNSRDDKLKLDYIKFMERHGHRGIRESEFIDKSWSQNPTQLMLSIQLIVRGRSVPEKETKSKTVSQIIDGLHTNLSVFQKMLLKLFFVEKAMKEVGDRELAKSNVIKVTDIFRQAYWKLADLVVSESRLPERDLLFFLTHREIGELIRVRSIKLVRISKKRKSIFPQMNDIRYPKINIGLPHPIQDMKPDYNRIPNATLHGMPVCRGKVEGRACVIESINEADQLLEGDVLVCKFTDVGWSPFYPLLSGLATEMGGLLSHGAIIAREYGIPCVVSITGVTDMIQTGDRVILDGAAGTFSTC